MVFFTADTHFGHENVIRFCDRPFASVEEMNETIIRNWNERVTDKDTVYILGDMFFRCETATVEDILKRLKGKKYLIVGNHDGSWMSKMDYKKYFVNVQSFMEVNDGQNTFICCHYPMLSWRHQARHNFYMIHGHIHNDTSMDFWHLLVARERALNAGVDLNGFKPVTLEELIENNRVFKDKNTRALDNLLGLTSAAELAREEERISKKKALALFENGTLDGLEAGTFSSLKTIHKYLFDEIYDFAGKLRTVNVAKGHFQFAPLMYLETTLENIDQMPQSTFDEIVEKYVEMNIAHPFREGNGRSMRIWLDCIFRDELHKVVDWRKVDKGDYLYAMNQSPAKDTEIKRILKAALIDDTHSLEVYTEGIDCSYYYEGFN